MIQYGKPCFVKAGMVNVNARWQVNAAGHPDSLGTYVGNVRKVIPKGFAGWATGLSRDGYRLLSRAEEYNGYVSIDQFFVGEQFLTNEAPADFTTADRAALEVERVLINGSNPYGIQNPYGGLGFDLPNWMKGIPGLLLLAGTVYVATRKRN